MNYDTKAGKARLTYLSSCWQVSSQDTKCKCLKAQKSLPGEDKGWTLRPLGGRAQVDSTHPPPQLLPWKGVETLLKADSPGGFRLIEAITLAQTCTLHPVARPLLQCYLSCEWSLG